MYLNYINYFRGVAIILIVLSHSIETARWHIASPLDRTLEAFLRNATVYFVFISGFLFHHIYCRKQFDFRKFFLTRTRFVLVPYILLSIIPIGLIILSGDRNGNLPAFFYDNPRDTFLLFLATGCTFPPYWYIPMAMLLFSLSPAVVVLMKKRWFPLVICFFFMLSVVIHRPVMNINPFHSALYFLPVYLLGIFLSMHRERFIEWLDGKLAMLFAGGLLFVLVQSMFYDNSGNFHKNMLDVTVIDVNLIQKLFFICFFIGILRRFEGREIGLLNVAAEYSFPIYFLHSILLDLIGRFVHVQFRGNFLTAVILSSVLTLASIFLARSAKDFLGDKSRFLVGR